MPNQKTEPVTVEDWGSTQYLDGIETQFVVVRGEDAVAYVFKREDAECMAAALSTNVAESARITAGHGRSTTAVDDQFAPDTSIEARNQQTAKEES